MIKLLTLWIIASLIVTAIYVAGRYLHRLHVAKQMQKEKHLPRSYGDWFK